MFKKLIILGNMFNFFLKLMFLLYNLIYILSLCDDLLNKIFFINIFF